MMQERLEKQLSLLEARLAELSEMLLTDDPVSIHPVSVEIHALAVSCAQLGASRQEGLQDFKPRLLALARGLAGLREQLVRRQAYVELSLQCLIPTATPVATYGSGKALYTGLNRMSGSLRPIAA